MFSFEKTDDGLYVHVDGRGFARVDTKVVSETNDPNLRVQKRVETPLPREQWKIHFAGDRFLAAEVEAFLKGLALQEG